MVNRQDMDITTIQAGISEAAREFKMLDKEQNRIDDLRKRHKRWNAIHRLIKQRKLIKKKSTSPTGMDRPV